MGVFATAPRFVKTAAALLSVVATSGAVQSSSPLRPGFTIEQPLKAGEVQQYDVNLTAGEYLELHIEQQDVDVQPMIVDPDGAVVYNYDYGEWGDEPVALITSKAGRYRLEIHTAEGSPPSGRYRLRVEAIRTPTATDIARTEAIRAQVEALPLIRSARPDYAKGRRQYEQILQMWESLGDTFGVAHVLTALRFAASEQDDRLAAYEYGTREVAAYRSLGHDYGEARALRGLAINLSALGRGEEAYDALERGLALHRAAGRTSSVTLLLADLANNRGGAGDFEAALQYAYEAISLARQNGNRRLEARGWSAAAHVHQNLGELDVAMDAFKRVRTLASPDDTLQSDAAMWMGTAVLSLGDLDEAQRLLEEGLAGWMRLGYRGQQAQALVGLGETHARRGALERAREYFEQAVSRAQEASFALGQVVARRKLADTLLRLGRVAEAASAIDATPLDLIANPNVRALSVAMQARVALAGGDLGRARRLSTDAVNLSESVRGRAEATRVEAGLLASSQPVYEAATDVLMASHDADPDAGYARQAFEMSERARARSLLESVEDGTGRGTGTTWTELREIRRALSVKAGALGNSRPGGSTRALLTRDIDELSAKATVLEGQLRREQPALGATAAAEPISVDRLQREMLDDNTVLVEYMFGRTRSYAWAISRTHFASYVLGPRAQIEDAAVRARDIASPPAQRSAAGFLESGAALGRLLLPPFRAVSAGQRVLVVAPGVLQDVPFAALPAGDGNRRPLVAAHELVYAPSAAVLMAVRAARAARTTPRRGIAVFADPVFEPTDPRFAQRTTAQPAQAAPPAPNALDRGLRGGSGERRELVRLPFTAMEAERIASVLPARDVMKATGFAASAAALKRGAANDFRIVHFATHGVLNTRTPELSGLVLSLFDEHGRPQDGFLRLQDLESLRLNAELVVLSGCETARGRRVEGEGTIGLTRGFLEAGARSVVASLWRVDDLATAELMEAFYRNLLRRRLPAPAALRAAQQQLAASGRWAHPYFWAGFVVQGDWR